MADRKLVNFIIEQYKKGYSLEAIKKHLLYNRKDYEAVESSIAEAKRIIYSHQKHQTQGPSRSSQYEFLLNYLRENLSRGFDPQMLKDHLIHKGYPPALVEQALNNTAPTDESPQEKNTSKNSLLLFLAIIMVFAPLAGLLIILEGDERNGETTDEEYILQVTSTDGGTTTPPSGSDNYEPGEEVTVKALPEAGYEFSHWDGGYPPGYRQEPELTINIDDDKSLIAHFSSTDTDPPEIEGEYTLTLDAEEGGSTDPSPGSKGYEEAQEVTVEALPKDGYEFSHWLGDYPIGYEQEPQLTLTLDEDKSLVAHFSSTDTDPPEIEGEHTLTLDAEEGGSTDPSPGSQDYERGEDVMVEALAEDGYEFSHWEGDYPFGYEQEPELTFTLNKDKSLVAHFSSTDTDPPEIEGEYTLTLDAEEGGSTDPSPSSQDYEAGKTIEVKAVIDDGWEFSGWEGDYPAGKMNDEDLMLQMDEDKTLTATFEDEDDDNGADVDVSGMSDRDIIDEVEIIDNKDEGIAMCEEITAMSLRDDCYKTLATGKVNDSSICQHLDSMRKYDSCYMHFVEEYGDFSLCDKLYNNYMQHSCELMEGTATVGEDTD